MLRPTNSENFMGALTVTSQLALRDIAWERELEPGEVFFNQGEPSTTIGIVIDGHLDLEAMNPAGTPVLIQTWSPGNLVGHVTALRRAPRFGTAVASTQAAMLVVDTNQFIELLATRPDMYPPLVDQLCSWVGLTVASAPGTAEVIDVSADRVERLTHPL